MIFLIIIGILLLIIAGILFLPVKVFIEFKEEFFLKVNFFGIKIYQLKPEEEKPQKTDSKGYKKSEKPAKSKPENLFLILKEKNGFSGAVKEIMAFALDCLTHIKTLLRHIKIKRICLDITVASPDAAKTAIDYGTVCSAVYPVLSLIDNIPNIEFRKIDVKSDFNSSESSFTFSLTVRLQIFFMLIAAFKIYKEYKNFIMRIEDNERK